MTENDDWYFTDDDQNDTRVFDRTLYQSLMASQDVEIDNHGRPLETTDRTMAIHHLATWVAKTGQPLYDHETSMSAMFRFAEKAGELVRATTGNMPNLNEIDPNAEGVLEVKVSDINELTQLFWRWRSLRHMGH